MHYPHHLKLNMPMIYPDSWVVDHIKVKYDASNCYPQGEEDALNIGIGCNNSVIISLYTLYCTFEL